MTEVAAIGGYSDSERAAYAEIGAVFHDTLSDLLAAPEDERAGVRVVAYKHHQAFGAAEMDKLPALALIANYGVGYDAISIPDADARGVKVTNTPNVLNDDVADLAIAMLLMQARGLVQGDAWVRSGTWAKEGPPPLARKVSGSRAGVVGLGRIGREIADRLAALKLEVHYHSRSEKETPGWTYHADPVSLADAVDFLVVALVGGPETEHYVSREVIDALGPQGVIVNISRGSTIDEGAMLDALEQGGLAGAGLDVFQGEPKVDPRFLELDNVVLQPHVGSATHGTRADMGKLQRRNVTAFLAGDALETPVN
ncbi:2-hydroxyacid dehydrogenase [Pelagovum pacificum]|uniref:2-hydroxyacid dehydrogenase n=1 Tax=Pelagovum pacificum TaxID=2588711 RepID=A0A5C5GB09_9RHOB|nr:2-hydroxyacid dehydrogenase [Pelagovum pacificum]QQA41197.1 2-hydroxyacid dehydrogenase [Pelagovum pacificum]TNY31995.1 2-hydroxyacid dehydrogenase [Pelagovum pacificum]